MSNIKSRFKFKREGDSLLIWSLKKYEFMRFEFTPNIILEDTYIEFAERITNTKYKIFIHDIKERKAVFDECMRVIFESEKIKRF